LALTGQCAGTDNLGKGVSFVPKIKTNKTAAKRFGITGTGLFTRTKGGKSHLRTRKSPRAKAQYDEMQVVSAADAPRIRRMLPYA
jgi:large subunit ribosomal protein L35